MKRKQFAALCLALLLAGCAATAPGTGQSGSAIPESLPAVQEEPAPAPDGPDLRVIPEANNCDSDESVLLLFQRKKEKAEYGERCVSLLACIMDYETGIFRPLCQKEGCPHQDGTCPAWGDWMAEGFLMKLAITDHYYVLLYDEGVRFGARFFPKDGGDPIVVARDKTEEECEAATMDSRLIVAGDAVYRELTYLPYKLAKGFLITPEGIEPCQWTQEYENIAGARGRELLLCHSVPVFSSGKTVEAWQAERENQKTRYYFRNIDTGKVRMLAEITGFYSCIVGQHAFYWTKQQDASAGTAIDYETGTAYSLPEGWNVFIDNLFMDTDGKCLLRNEAGEVVAVDYKTGETRPFSYRESYVPMGFAGGKMLMREWSEIQDRWGLWDMEDYRENKGEPAWFDFSACDAYLGQ